MKQTRMARRRAAAIASAKVALTSVSLAATLGGWAAISAMQNAELAASVAEAPAATNVVTNLNLPAASVPATATSVSPLSLNPTSPAAASTPAASVTAPPTSTVAPTAVPTQVPVQPTVRSRSSR